MKADFMWIAGGALSNLRLYVEGAIVLFEGDALPLTRLANKHQELTAADAMDTIGEALYRMQEHIRYLQEAYSKEIDGQTPKEETSST